MVFFSYCTLWPISLLLHLFLYFLFSFHISPSPSAPPLLPLPSLHPSLSVSVCVFFLFSSSSVSYYIISLDTCTGIIFWYIYITDKNQRKTTSWHKSSQIFGWRLPRGFILNNWTRVKTMYIYYIYKKVWNSGLPTSPWQPTWPFSMASVAHGTEGDQLLSFTSFFSVFSFSWLSLFHWHFILFTFILFHSRLFYFIYTCFYFIHTYFVSFTLVLFHSRLFYFIYTCFYFIHTCFVSFTLVLFQLHLLY